MWTDFINFMSFSGAQLNTIGDETMSIFAPSRSVMDEVIERINQMMNALSPEASHVLLYNWMFVIWNAES